jgi:NADPH2:quinone reductase
VTTHRAWQFDTFGPFRDVLRLREVPTPTPGEGECLVRLMALALNFPDLLVISGAYQVKPELPAVPGMEAMGVVEAVGPNARFRPGQRVCVNVVNGAFAEKGVFPDALLLDVPEGMSDAQGAAFHVTYQTSLFALEHRAGLKANETLLVHGAAGGVGTAAVQLGKALGARVIATAGGPEKTAVAKACGADDVIDTRSEDFVARVKALTDGRGADVIYDPIGGTTFDQSTKVLAFEGRLLVIGFASGVIPTVAVNRLLLKTASVVGLQWGMYKFVAPGKVQAAHERLSALFREGRIAPVIDPARFSFEQLPDALAHLESRAAVGKVVVAG